MDVAVIVRRDGVLTWCEREFSLGRIARIQLRVLEATVRLEHDHGDPCLLYTSCEDVGTELHEEIVLTHAAVNMQLPQLDSRVELHGAQHIVDLIALRLKAGAHQMRPFNTCLLSTSRCV